MWTLRRVEGVYFSAINAKYKKVIRGNRGFKCADIAAGTRKYHSLIRVANPVVPSEGLGIAG